VGKQGSFNSQGGSFLSFAGDLHQAPSQHGGALCSVAGFWRQGITCQGRALDAILETGDCVPRQPWVHTLQRQRDPTKGKRLWLVLDGVVRAWAN